VNARRNSSDPFCSLVLCFASPKPYSKKSVGAGINFPISFLQHHIIAFCIFSKEIKSGWDLRFSRVLSSSQTFMQAISG